MGFTQARRQVMLDTELADTDYVGYSANGTSETGLLARTAVGSWSAATAATPSVASPAGALTTAAATGAVTVSHFAIFSAVTGGIQRTDWQALAVSKALAIDDQGTWAVGDLDITLA